MFKIYGGHTKFKQWSKDQKLSMKDLPVGAEVLFYQDPGADDPLITEVYEITESNGTVSRVCNVPNILLQDSRRIKVRIPDKVVSLYGIVHKYAGGPNEKYFEVEAAEKPGDYVYEETPVVGGGSGGEVSDERIETAVEKYMEENDIIIGGVPEGGIALWAELVD